MRSKTPRVVLDQQELTARGLRFRYATELIDSPTDWCCYDDSRHLVYVHRHGALRTMDTCNDWGTPGSDLRPWVGDIWVVPAGEQCSSLVQGGESAGFCEISIPARAIGDETLLARVKMRDPLFYQLTERLFKLVERQDPMSRLLGDSLAETLRLHLVDSCTPPRRRLWPEPGRRTLDSATRSALVEFLEDALDSEITLEALADFADMQVGRFIKAFTDAFQTTPYQFLLDRRIERAKSLLSTTTRTVAEISGAVGFSTPNHFATAFKRRVGVSPRDYRRNG